MTALLREIVEIIFNPFVFPGIFITFWVYTSFSSARESGWNKLKEKFKYKKDINHVQYCMGSGRFSKVFYRGLRIGLCNDGIIVKQYIHLVLFHPALFFPWSEFSNIMISSPEKSVFNILHQGLFSKISRKAWIGQSAEVSFRNYHDIKIIFPWQKVYRVLLPKDFTIMGNV